MHEGQRKSDKSNYAILGNAILVLSERGGQTDRARTYEHSIVQPNKTNYHHDLKINSPLAARSAGKVAKYIHTANFHLVHLICAHSIRTTRRLEEEKAH